MKTSILALALMAAPIAFGHSEKTTQSWHPSSTTSQNAEKDALHSSTNSNDRFDNRDTRTNSLSTPAHVGGSASRLGRDVTLESRSTAGTSTAGSGRTSTDMTSPDLTTDPQLESTTRTQSEWMESETTENQRFSGSSTTSSPRATVVPTESKEKMKTTGQVKKDMKYKADRADSAVTAPAAASPMMGEDRMHEETQTTQTSGSATAVGSATAASDLTAQDTSRNAKEAEVVRKIRSQITDNKDLSMRAHNIKVISQNGQIFLKGPVANESEKSKVEEIAKKMAGQTAVVNETYVENR